MKYMRAGTRFCIQSLVFYTLCFGTACSLYRPEHIRNEIVATPVSYENQYDNAATSNAQYVWETFGSAELDRLVQTALRENHNLAAAEARVAQAGFGARIAWSQRFPSFTYSAGVSKRFQNQNGTQQDQNSLQLGVAGSYEVDLWGRMRASHRSKQAQFEATNWDYRAAQTTIATEVALRWIDYIAAQNILQTLEIQHEAVVKTTELLRLYYRQGAADWTDVLGQRQSALTLEEEIAQTRTQSIQVYNELRLLLGDAGLQAIAITTTSLPNVPQPPTQGIPADLLTQRPDVHAAWHRLRTQDWAVAAAQADRFPKLELSASFEYAAATPQNIFQNWIANLVAGLVGPLFDFRGRAFAAKQAQAGANAAIADLKQVFLAAYFDVETALSTRRYLLQRGDALALRTELATERAQRIRKRYLAGQASYLELFTAENEQRGLVRSRIAWHADMLIQYVQLTRALGGGWLVAELSEEQNTTKEVP